MGHAQTELRIGSEQAYGTICSQEEEARGFQVHLSPRSGQTSFGSRVDIPMVSS